MDQGALEGAMDGASDRSEASGTSGINSVGPILSHSVVVFLNRYCIYCPVIGLTTVANAYCTVT